MKSEKKKIAFVGGGTLGPVTPLLAVLRTMKKNDSAMEYIWFGTAHGPERALIPPDVRFYDIPVAKLPRYPSFAWMTFPFNYFAANYKARKILKKERPDIIVGAGGFTQVPVITSAHEQGIPSVIHQLDKVPGMSNQMIALKADSVTTSFAYEEGPFSEPVKSRRIATPVRFSKEDLISKEEAAKHFDLDPKKPITLIIGGGTGALSVNEAVVALLDELLGFTQVLHITGKGKKVMNSRAGYAAIEFLEDDLILAYSAADLVVSRAGMGSISECVALEKPLILIPIMNSHQEKNAEQMEKGGERFRFGKMEISKKHCRKG